MSVIYIHGIWNHPRLAVLKHRWDEALFPGPPDRPQTRMARWSGVRYPEPVSYNEVIAGIQAAKQGIFPPGLPVWLDKAGRAWADRLFGQIDGTVASRWFRWFLAVFVQDAAAYFFRPGERREIQDILRDELRHAPGPVVLVAHSLGSVIAYDVLHEGMGVEVPLLVTCGSPLGLEPIQELVKTPLSLPPGVRRWRNFLDPLDPVAQGRRIGFEDTEVVNPDRRIWYRAGPHSETGYLRTAEVGGAVRATIGL
jgi:hypothetical protein